MPPQALLRAAALALLLRPSVQQTQRITTCPCNAADNSQRWFYPATGSVGPVNANINGKFLTWVFTPDGCAWGGVNNTCIELASGFTRNFPSWNVTPGVAPNTVIFQLVSGYPGAEPNTLCADWNKALGLLELYPCYAKENMQQELYEGDNGQLIEECVRSDNRAAAAYLFAPLTHLSLRARAHTPLPRSSNNQCLCPDTRNSQTASASPSPAAPPPAPAPAAGGSGGSSGAAVGVGVTLGLLGAGAIGLYVASLATGVPIAAMVGGWVGKGGGALLPKLSPATMGVGSEAASARVKMMGGESASLLRA